jgi:hypothetical protein
VPSGTRKCPVVPVVPVAQSRQQSHATSKGVLGEVVCLQAVVELRGGFCVTGAPEMDPQTARGMDWVVW